MTATAATVRARRSPRVHSRTGVWGAARKYSGKSAESRDQTSNVGVDAGSVTRVSESGKRDGILLHGAPHGLEHRPPSVEQCVESHARGGADGVHGERIGCPDRWRRLRAHKIHLGDDNTMR